MIINHFFLLFSPGTLYVLLVFVDSCLSTFLENFSISLLTFSPPYYFWLLFLYLRLNLLIPSHSSLYPLLPFLDNFSEIFSEIYQSFF